MVALELTDLDIISKKYQNILLEKLTKEEK